MRNQIALLEWKYTTALQYIQHLAKKIDAVLESIPKKTLPTEQQADDLNLYRRIINVMGSQRYLLVREINRIKLELKEK